MKDTIKIIYVEPLKKPVVMTIKNDYETRRELVGGYLEYVSLNKTISMICDEEGKLNGATPNRYLGDDIICGPFLIVKTDGTGDLTDLSEKEIAYFTAYFDDAPEIDPGDVNATWEIYTW